jgi:amino acid adenylation domain-containing protein
MLAHFKTLFEGFAENPQQPLSSLSPLTEAERHQLLLEWNNTESSHALERCVNHLFEEQVRRTPDAAAVAFEEEELTYRELNARANQLAHYLKRLAAGPGLLVAILMERSIDMLVALLGVLKAGGACLPLDPSYPHERTSFMLEDAGVSVLLTEERLSDEMAELKTEVVCLDRDWGKIASESKKDTDAGVSADHLAYIIYTSGSTGQPKGVAMRHGPLANLIVFQVARSTLSARAKTLQYASLSFDVSFQEIFSTWCSGGTLVLISEELRRDASALLRLMADQSIERLFAPFVTLQQLAEVAHRSSLPGRLREIITAGEQLEMTPQIRSFLKGLRGCTLYNQYGPSESHVVTEFALTGDIDGMPVLPPIGTPIPNARLYLLNANLQPVPIGVTGELYIGGEVLARGYINRAELTAERFIPEPFGPHPGLRLYRTGDMARYLSNGDIEFLGRADNQVKIRGFRIELGELEAALRLHPAVRDVAIAAKPSAAGGKRLVAYIIANGAYAQTDETSLVSEVRTFMRKKLPEHMVPSAFVMIEALPLTPSGKIDRKALLDPVQLQAEVAERHAGPRDPLEAQLIALWEDLLGVRPISRRDDFFELGGHSLLAVRLMDRIKQIYDKKLPLSTLYAGATVEHLGQALLDREEAALLSPLVPLKTGGTKRPFFFLHGDFNGGGFYSLNLARYLDEDQPFYILHPHGLDGRQVPQTIEAMAASHLEVLRSCQPEGPYMLGGFCNGALIALEMSHLLQAQGEKVDLLVLIHASATNVRFKYLRRLVSTFGPLLRLELDKQQDLFMRLTDFFRRMSKLPTLGQFTFVLSKMRRIPSRIASRLIDRNSKRLAGDISSPIDYTASINADRFRRNTEIWSRYVRAMRTYIPRPYSSRVSLFWPSEEIIEDSEDPTVGWGRIAAEVDLHLIPGDHLTCITRHSEVLAEHLNTCLREAQAGDPDRE